MRRRPLINNLIRAREVRVVDETGKQLGVMSLKDALGLSYGRNLDLIQVTEKVEPPVCKIMDYGKYQYLQKKKERSGKKQKAGELKGIRLGFNISLHDMETKAHQAEKFLKKGYKVRIEMKLKGRERALENFAKEKINKFLEILKNFVPIKTEKELKREARGLTMIILKE